VHHVSENRGVQDKRIQLKLKLQFYGHELQFNFRSVFCRLLQRFCVLPGISLSLSTLSTLFFTTFLFFYLIALSLSLIEIFFVPLCLWVFNLRLQSWFFLCDWNYKFKDVSAQICIYEKRAFLYRSGRTINHLKAAMSYFFNFLAHFLPLSFYFPSLSFRRLTFRGQ